MSKVVSFILILVLFFGPVVNSFAEGGEMDEDTVMWGVIIVGGILVAGLIIWGVVEFFKDVGSWFSEAETPDDGIRMVSSENEITTVKKDDKTILNVLKHVEAGVTPNNDIYVGLRFQY